MLQNQIFFRLFFDTVEMLLDPFGKRKRIIILEVFLNRAYKTTEILEES